MQASRLQVGPALHLYSHVMHWTPGSRLAGESSSCCCCYRCCCCCCCCCVAAAWVLMVWWCPSSTASQMHRRLSATACTPLRANAAWLETSG